MKNFLLLALLFLICSCSNANDNVINKTKQPKQPHVSQKTQIHTHSFSSFPYPLVKWEDRVYRLTTEEISNVFKNVGEIEIYSLDENDSALNNFSNFYTVGTKIWTIKDVESNKEIAIEKEKGIFVKAINEFE